MFSSATGMVDQLVNLVIRPPRAEYSEAELLGPVFHLKGKGQRKYKRHDIELVNVRGHVLKCSHYTPHPLPKETKLPCVVYCHGNSGCRADGNEAALILLPENITVFAFDFSGSGQSGGEYVTLGSHEKDDLISVVDYLRLEGNTSTIGLWGRSMGAVTCLLYGATDLTIAGMVLDSPFSNLSNLILELADYFKIRLPKFTVKMAIQLIRRAAKQKADFDICDLDVAAVAPSCFIPALFCHGAQDDFIQPHHSREIHDAYAGDKNLISFDGDHNSPRPRFVSDSLSIFFRNVLNPPEHQVGQSEHNEESPEEVNSVDKALWMSLVKEGNSNNGAQSTSIRNGLISHSSPALTQPHVDNETSAINQNRREPDFDPEDEMLLAAIALSLEDQHNDALAGSVGSSRDKETYSQSKLM